MRRVVFLFPSTFANLHMMSLGAGETKIFQSLGSGANIKLLYNFQAFVEISQNYYSTEEVRKHGSNLSLYSYF